MLGIQFSQFSARAVHVQQVKPRIGVVRGGFGRRKGARYAAVVVGIAGGCRAEHEGRLIFLGEVGRLVCARSVHAVPLKPGRRRMAYIGGDCSFFSRGGFRWVDHSTAWCTLMDMTMQSGQSSSIRCGLHTALAGFALCCEVCGGQTRLLAVNIGEQDNSALSSELKISVLRGFHPQDSWLLRVSFAFRAMDSWLLRVSSTFMALELNSGERWIDVDLRTFGRGK